MYTLLKHRNRFVERVSLSQWVFVSLKSDLWLFQPLLVKGPHVSNLIIVSYISFISISLSTLDWLESWLKRNNRTDWFHISKISHSFRRGDNYIRRWQKQVIYLLLSLLFVIKIAFYAFCSLWIELIRNWFCLVLIQSTYFSSSITKEESKWICINPFWSHIQLNSVLTTG